MSGNYLLDTNAIINALKAQIQLAIGSYYISIITELELLSFPKLTLNEEIELKAF